MLQSFSILTFFFSGSILIGFTQTELRAVRHLSPVGEDHQEIPETDKVRRNNTEPIVIKKLITNLHYEMNFFRRLSTFIFFFDKLIKFS